MSQASTIVPLSTDEAGVLRVAGTRVPLDSVVHAFVEGATPEEIVQDFPTLDLASVYAVVGYYLQNRSEVELYLARRAAERGALKEETEARFDPRGVRERLSARKRQAGP